jgi:hypothetical protein
MFARSVRKQADRAPAVAGQQHRQALVEMSVHLRPYIRLRGLPGFVGGQMCRLQLLLPIGVHPPFLRTLMARSAGTHRRHPVPGAAVRTLLVRTVGLVWSPPSGNSAAASMATGYGTHRSRSNNLRLSKGPTEKSSERCSH